MEKPQDNKSRIKQLAIFFAAVIGAEAGYAYSYELFDTLQIPLREDPYNFTTDNFNNLFVVPYTIIVFLNIPLTIYTVKGHLISTVFLVGLIGLIGNVLSGLVLIWIFENYILMLYVLRSLCALGYEAWCVLMYFMAAKYGKPIYQQVIGYMEFSSFMITGINFYLTAKIYKVTQSVPDTWFFASFLSLFSLICCCFCMRKIYSWHVSHSYKQEWQDQKVDKSLIISSTSSEEISSTQKQKTEASSNQRSNRQILIPKKEQPSQAISFKDITNIKKLSSIYWFLTVSLFFSSLSTGSFINNLDELMVARFNVDYEVAGALMIISYAAAAILALIIGKVMNLRPQWRRKMSLISCVSFCVGLLVVFLMPNIEREEDTPWTYLVAIVLFILTFSFAYSVQYVCIESCIIMVVDEDKFGIAMGAKNTIGYIPYFISPLINSAFITNVDDLAGCYERYTLCCFGIALLPVLCSLAFQHQMFNRLDHTLEQDDNLQ